MKTLLVPFDFSAEAEDGLNYAVELARIIKARLLLLHVNPPDVESKEDSERLNNRLLRKCLNITRASSVACDYLSDSGKLVEKIVEVGANRRVNLIVMGSGGESDLGKVLFGSNAAATINDAKIPVLMVPAGYVFKGIKKIAFATDYKLSDSEILKVVIDLAGSFNAQVNLLHIYSDEQQAHNQREEMKKFMESMLAQTDYNNLSFQILSKTSDENTLKEYLDADSADLLVMSTHHRTLFGKLFGKSTTTEMIYNSTVPLLAFHYQKETAVKLI